MASTYELKAKNSIFKGEPAKAKEYYAMALEFYEKQGMKEKAELTKEELRELA